MADLAHRARLPAHCRRPKTARHDQPHAAHAARGRAVGAARPRRRPERLGSLRRGPLGSRPLNLQELRARLDVPVLAELPRGPRPQRHLDPVRACAIVSLFNLDPLRSEFPKTFRRSARLWKVASPAPAAAWQRPVRTLPCLACGKKPGTDRKTRHEANYRHAPDFPGFGLLLLVALAPLAGCKSGPAQNAGSSSNGPKRRSRPTFRFTARGSSPGWTGTPHRKVMVSPVDTKHLLPPASPILTAGAGDRHGADPGSRALHAGGAQARLPE